MCIMGAIQSLTDAEWTKTAAVIDLKTYEALLGDIQDVLISRSRKSEEGVSLPASKNLIPRGKLCEVHD